MIDSFVDQKNYRFNLVIEKAQNGWCVRYTFRSREEEFSSPSLQYVCQTDQEFKKILKQSARDYLNFVLEKSLEEKKP